MPLRRVEAPVRFSVGAAAAGGGPGGVCPPSGHVRCRRLEIRTWAEGRLGRARPGPLRSPPDTRISVPVRVTLPDVCPRSGGCEEEEGMKLIFRSLQQLLCLTEGAEGYGDTSVFVS